jgi:hypothetical protein
MVTGPYPQHPPSTEYLCLAIPFAILPVLWPFLFRRRKMYKWMPLGRCPYCGYDLRATPDRPLPRMRKHLEKSSLISNHKSTMYERKSALAMQFMQSRSCRQTSISVGTAEPPVKVFQIKPLSRLSHSIRSVKRVATTAWPERKLMSRERRYGYPPCRKTLSILRKTVWQAGS